MVTVKFVLLIMALIAFIGAACNVPSRINLTALGLALWVLSLVVS